MPLESVGFATLCLLSVCLIQPRTFSPLFGCAISSANLVGDISKHPLSLSRGHRRFVRDNNQARGKPICVRRKRYFNLRTQYRLVVLLTSNGRTPTRLDTLLEANPHLTE
jgi:hypothetical protein